MSASAPNYPRRRIKPAVSQIPSATHSAPEKCPGNTGNNFISNSSRETAMPSEVITRRPDFFSTIQKDRHAMNHPLAAAMEPTSVTGTSIASPSSKPRTVAHEIPTIATDGVKKVSCTLPKPE